MSFRAAILSIASLTLFVSGSPHLTAAPGPCLAVPVADDRCETWVHTYDHPNGYGEYGWDAAQAVATSPTGARAYVAGFSHDDSTGEFDIVVVAVDTSTGTRAWVTRYDGPSSGFDRPTEVAVAPDGRTVFVTGIVDADFNNQNGNFGTLAIDAETGAQRWSAVLDWAGLGRPDWPKAIAVSPSGDEIYVTGEMTSAGEEPDRDYATVAYRAADGAALWRETYDGPMGTDQAQDVAVSPDGLRVFVTGESLAISEPREYDSDMTTVAYDTSPGVSQRQVWVHRFDGGARLADAAEAIGVSPDGRRVYLTGYNERTGHSQNLYTNYEATTLSLDASSGTPLWVQRFGSPSLGVNGANDLAVTSTDRVVVAGALTGRQSDLESDFGIAAYDGASGAQRWTAHYASPGATFEAAESVAVTPDGTRAFVTGYSRQGLRQDALTVAFDVVGGGQAWVARYNAGAAGTNFDLGAAAATTADGRRLVVGVAVNDNLSFTLNQGSTEFNCCDLGILGYDA